MHCYPESVFNLVSRLLVLFLENDQTRDFIERSMDKIVFGKTNNHKGVLISWLRARIIIEQLITKTPLCE